MVDVHTVAQVSTEGESSSNCAEIVPPILIMEDDDDPLLQLAINPSQQEVYNSGFEDQKEVNVIPEPGSLVEALEKKLNSIPSEQYTVIQVTHKTWFKEHLNS